MPAEHEAPRTSVRKMTKQGYKGEDLLLVNLAAGRSIGEACTAAGISIPSGYRRLSSKDFEHRLSTIRQSLIRGIRDRLLDSASQAVDTLVALLHEGSSPNIRLNAARALLSLVLPRESLAEHITEPAVKRELQVDELFAASHASGLYDERLSALYATLLEARHAEARGEEAPERKHLEFQLLRETRRRLFGDSSTPNPPSFLLKGPQEDAH